MMSLQRFVSVMLLLLIIGLGGSALAQAPLPLDQAFVLKVSRQADGDVAFDWTIAPGHYLYRDHTAATGSGAKDALPLRLAPGERKDDPGFGVVDVWYGKGRAVLSAEALAAAGAPRSIDITFQGCLEDAICYPPTTRTVETPAKPASPASAPTTPAPATPVVSVVQPPKDVSTEPTGPLVEPAAPEPSPLSPSEAVPTPDGLIDSLALKGGALWVLAAFFGFGLLLAFTPCVFPMYPILAGVIGRGVDGRGTRRGLILSIAYVLGLAAAFALLGVAAAWSGQNLQVALQSAWAVGGLSLIFLALAISMFGGFELQLPSAWTSRFSREEGQGRRSAPSAAAMGFVSALIVGPCVTAPLAGALLYIAQTGDVVLGAAALFFLGLGKGVPLIVFGTAGARFLPKAGPWMDRVKTAFGFAFLGMAWWLAGRILPPAVTLATGAALSFAAAAVLGLFNPATNNLISNLARSAGLAASLWGALILIGLGLGAVDPWRPLAPLMSANSGAAATPSVVPTAIVEDQATLEQALARAADVRRPAVLYFTADWCTICKAVDRRVLADPATIAAFAAADLIKVDVTQNTAETRDLMKRYGVAGPPTMIFLTASSTEATGARLIGDMTAHQVQTALEHAGARS